MGGVENISTTMTRDELPRRWTQVKILSLLEMQFHKEGGLKFRETEITSGK